MAGTGSYVVVGEDNFSQGSPWSLVNSRFDMTQGYAEQSFEAAVGYMSDMADMIGGFSPPSIEVDNVVIPEVTGLDYIKRPTVGEADISTNWPVNGATLGELSDLPVLVGVDIPTLSIAPPDWTNVEKPQSTEITPPGEAPVLRDISVPVAPSLTLPDSPIFDDIALPPAPVITLPTFDAEVPDIILDLPEGFSFQEGNFSSDVLESLKSKILYDIKYGGTGLAPLVEAELIDRAHDRQSYEDEKLYQEVEQGFSASGFDLPPGAMVGALLETGQQISRNKADLNGKIFISQAELAQKNTHATQDRAQLFFTAEIEFHNAQANRALEASKTVATIGIELFNAKVNKFNAFIDKYKADAVVYESRVKAAITEVEIFKAQIEGARVTVETQKLLADIYEKQLAAVELYVKIYAEEMNAAKIASEIEQSKLETFRLQTQAYVARLDGEKTKFETYTAELDGEKAKAAVYESEVRAFLGEVEATKAIIDAENAKADLVLKDNSAKIDKYKAELGGYIAEVDAMSKTVTAQVDGFRAEVSAYSAETQAEGSYYDAKAKEMDVRMSNAKLQLDKAIAEVNASINGYVALKNLEVEANKGVTQVSAQIASAALNAVNASASYGYSAAENRSETWGHSDGITESHKFDETPT